MASRYPSAWLDELRSRGKSDSVLRNVYIKMMCWLYYRFERLMPFLGGDTVPKVLYEGNSITNHELIFLRILSAIGVAAFIAGELGDAAKSANPAAPGGNRYKSISHKDFPSNYHEKATGGVPAGYCPNQDHQITAEGLYECSDGSVILLGEQKTMRSVTTQAGNMQITTYYYFARGVVYDKTDSNGEITQSKIFEKRQMAAAGSPGFSYKRMGVSYYPFFENDKLYILYADNSANYAGKSNMVYKNTVAGKKYYCCTLLTIDENGKGETQKLMDLKTTKRMITTPLFKTDDGFIVVESMKKTANISHLPANF